MMPDLSLAALADRLGPPERLNVTLHPRELFDPIWKTDRRGEVAFVLLRPDGALWLMEKDFYPPGTFRLPTGGIGPREPAAQALRREVLEETGWRVEPTRYLAAITYHFLLPGGEQARFETHAFLLPCGTAPPQCGDPDERLGAWRSVPAAELAAVAANLARLPVVKEPGVGYWSDYGAFRAVVHRTVALALTRGE